MSELKDTILYLLRSLSLIDVLDIAIVAYLIYYVLRFVKGTSIMSIFKGIAILIVALYMSELLKLNAMHFILSNTMQIGLVAVIIMFQPELRRLLESLGSSKISNLIRRQVTEGDLKTMILAVSEACGNMSWSHTGALIIFERKIRLDTIVNSGTEIDALPSSELIRNIFFVNSPLHDGAMIIRGERLYAAGAVLPLTKNENLPSQLGTRHRAGIGITEVSDAIALIVSEETGTISIVESGNITRGLSSAEVASTLFDKLTINDEEIAIKKNKILGIFRKGAENK